MKILSDLKQFIHECSVCEKTKALLKNTFQYDKTGELATTLSKNMQTRSHTDNFGENNVKCLIAKGICRFVPHSSAGGF